MLVKLKGHVTIMEMMHFFKESIKTEIPKIKKMRVKGLGSHNDITVHSCQFALPNMLKEPIYYHYNTNVYETLPINHDTETFITTEITILAVESSEIGIDILKHAVEYFGGWIYDADSTDCAFHPVFPQAQPQSPVVCWVEGNNIHFENEADCMVLVNFLCEAAI